MSLVEISEMTVENRLLILDLDGMLAVRDDRASTTYLEEPVFPIKSGAGAWYINRKAKSFVRQAFERYDVAVFTTECEDEARPVLEEIFGPFLDLCKFVWYRARAEGLRGVSRYYYHKSLDLVWEAFPMYTRRNTLICSDNSFEVYQNPHKNIFMIPALLTDDVIFKAIENAFRNMVN